MNATPLLDLVSRQPDDETGVVAAIESFMRMEEMHVMDHVVRLGCQSALEKLSHLLLELHDRLNAIGFVHDGSFSLPMSQELLGHMLGLSLVHVNRTLREMKRQEIISTRGKTVFVLDRELLAFTAGFYPATSCWNEKTSTRAAVNAQVAT